MSRTKLARSSNEAVIHIVNDWDETRQSHLASARAIVLVHTQHETYE